MTLAKLGLVLLLFMADPARATEQAESISTSWSIPVLVAGVLLLTALVGSLLFSGMKNSSLAKSTPSNSHRSSASSELRAALNACRGALISTAVFSGLVNILMLTSSIFMPMVYDRVLSSYSVPTLVGLCILAGLLFAALALLDVVRNRLLVRIGSVLDEEIAPRVFQAMLHILVRSGPHVATGLQPLRDLDAIKTFLSGQGPTAFFDLPWIPFYLAIIFAFHPLLGVTALIGAIILVGLALLTEASLRKPSRTATTHNATRLALAETCLRNSEVLAGMGFTSRLTALWQVSNDQTRAAQQKTSDVSGGLGAISRVLRMALQSSVLAVGAYLVIHQEASPGIIIAGAILAARALAPVDLAIAQWRGVVNARDSWQRLTRLLAAVPTTPQPMALPAPCDRLQVEHLTIVPPGDRKIVLADVSFVLNRGQAMEIVGPSGTGKTSLARALVGAWPPMRGAIRLDGAAFDQWTPENIGRHIGYLPQDVELFPGTIAQNIARFDPDTAAEAVIKAARAADIHDLIVSFPKGYETDIGDGGSTLSAGQRQRLALARALYGDPFLVVLDEPDASLDVAGEQALRKAIMDIRARGGIVIVISHRQMVLGAVDMVLALQRGQPPLFGPKEAIMQKLRPGPAAAPSVAILKSIAETIPTNG